MSDSEFRRLQRGVEVVLRSYRCKGQVEAVEENLADVEAYYAEGRITAEQRDRLRILLSRAPDGRGGYVGDLLAV